MVDKGSEALAEHEMVPDNLHRDGDGLSEGGIWRR